jgi:hypothetical protein
MVLFQQQQQRQRSHPPWDAALLDDLAATAAAGAFPHYLARDLCQLVYSLGQLRHLPASPGTWVRGWAAAAGKQLPYFTGQGLANAAYGLATLVQLAGGLPGQQLGDGGEVDQARLQVSAGSSWMEGVGSYGAWRTPSTSTTTSGSSSNSSSSSVPGPSTSVMSAADVAAAQQWMGDCLRFASLHLSTLSQQELIGQLLWAAGQLGVAPLDHTLTVLMQRTQQLLPAASDQDLAEVLVAVCRMQLRPPAGWWAAYWEALSQGLERGMGTRSLTAVLSAVAQSKLRPPPSVAAALQAAARTRAVAPGCPVKYSVQLLYFLAVWGDRQPQRWLVRYCTASRPLLEQYKALDYTSVLWSLAQLGFEPDAR